MNVTDRLADATARTRERLAVAVAPATDRLPTLVRPARAERLLTVADDNGWALLAGLTALAALVPLGLDAGFYLTVITELFLFAVLALSWDLVGGQTGYPSFGQMAFFGLGAYTTAILTKDFAVGFPTALLVAGALALVAAAVVGGAVLRLRGGYFAIATLGVLLATQQVSRNLEITGGPSGKILIDNPAVVPVPPFSGLSAGEQFYYLFLGVLVAEVAVVYYLDSTRFGHVLNAIRDDEEKATAMGFNTTYYKTGAWMLAALFTGFVGGGWSLFNTFVDPLTAYNLAWNVELIAMALLGGAGTIAGPVLGAAGLHLAITVIDTLFAGWQLAVVGGVIIATVIAFPDGVVGFLHERASAMEYYRHGGQAAGEPTGNDPVSEEPAGGATDPTPTTAGENRGET